jgi:hypothetical protein
MTNKARWLYLLGLLATAAAMSACASGGYVYGDRQYDDYGRYGHYSAYGGDSRDVEQIAHQNGYHEGREAGEQDARRGHAFSFDRHDDWRDADHGYHREYGNREFYRHEFREGFQRGYSDGYNAYAHAHR